MTKEPKELRGDCFSALLIADRIRRRAGGNRGWIGARIDFLPKYLYNTFINAICGFAS
jgi:hypothetical protein